jgi:hypothetical protein
MTGSGPQSRKGKLRGGHGRRGIAVGRALLRVNAGPGRVLGADCTMDVWDADDGRATTPLAGASESSHDRLRCAAPACSHEEEKDEDAAVVASVAHRTLPVWRRARQ